MSKSTNQNIIIGGTLLPTMELTVSALRKVATQMELSGRSKLKTKDALVVRLSEVFVTHVHVINEETATGEEVVRYEAKVNEVPAAPAHQRRKLKTFGSAIEVLVSAATDLGVNNPNNIIAEVRSAMAAGFRMGQLVEDATDKGISLHYVPVLNYVKSIYDVRVVSAPTRKSVMALEAEIKNGTVDEVLGKVVVQGKYVRQSQSSLFDSTTKKKDYFKQLPDGTFLRTNKHDEKAKHMLDGTHVVFAKFEMPLEEGQEDLTDKQKQLQFVAMNGGVIIEVDGEQIHAEYLYQTPSQQRLVQATFVADMDPIDVLEVLGHDFRVYASIKANGKWSIDMSKAIKRFGLSGTNTIASSVVKVGNKVSKMANGDTLLSGGTHTMRITGDAHAFVKTGEYKVYEMQTGKFRTVDAAEHNRMLAAGDGQVFCDESVYSALVAEFGLDTSAWQIRITPFTKGLMIFVPFLNDMYGADIVAFDSAVKGNYETLFASQPNYEIQVRVALFNKPAKMAKQYTNIPYQFVNTLPLGPSAYLEIADRHLDRAFELYEDPKLMSEYLGLNVLSDLEELSDEDLSEDQREFAKNTLVSNFTEFLYSGEFTMKDPMMKKYAKDIILNVIKQWSFGSVPVEGHYRFMVQDPYAILEAKRQFDRLERAEVAEHEYKHVEDGKVYTIIPSHVGIPAERVVMVDDNDKYFMDGKDVVFNRNPKIAFGETAIAKTIVTEEYYLAREAYNKAFINLAVFSVHDFNTFKQGGADNDGDTTLAMLEKSIVEAVKATSSKFPALLDISVDKDGNFIEGCPFTNPKMDKNEFKREFTDAEYNRELARDLHELSKVYVLRTLEPNDIGKLTNFATKILDAVSKLTIAVNNNLTVDCHPLSAADKISYLKEIKSYLHYTDILRLAQGWEIDKAKHGGYYKIFMNLKFINEEESFPFFATQVNKKGKRVWITIDWMAARKGGFGVNTGSTLQLIRNHVAARFTNEIEGKFLAMDPVSSNNNLSAELSLAVQKPAFYDDIVKATRIVKSKYAKGIAEALQWKSENMMKLESYTVDAKGMKVSYQERLRLNTIIETKFDNMMNFVREESNAAMSTLELEFNVHPAVLGVAAYEITYAENNNINRNIKANTDPTRGLSFPWAGAKYQLMAAVRLVSGKDMKFTNVEKVEAKGLQLRVGSLLADPNFIKEQALARGKVAIWNQPITDPTSPFFGYHDYGVYVGPVKIGSVFADKAHAFSGHAQWVVNITGVDYKEAADGTVRAMSFDMDTINPYVKH